MKRYNTIFITVVPTSEKNGGLLKLQRGLSWAQGLRPLSLDTIGVGCLFPAHAKFSALSPARSAKPSYTAKVWAKEEQKKLYSYGFPAYYKDLEADKDRILKENEGKAAIYMITNRITKKKYIGKSEDLRGRFVNYFSKEFLERNKGSSLIHRNLLRFGFENFSLTILEYCPADQLQNKEQHFIDILMPSLNIRKRVTNSNKPKVSKKNLTAQQESNPKSQNEIINGLLKQTTDDLEELKKNITIPLEVNEMIDLAESPNNPLEWRYQIDKESKEHYAVWFYNNKTDNAFYGNSAYWKDGEILNINGFYKLKVPKPNKL